MLTSERKRLCPMWPVLERTLRGRDGVRKVQLRRICTAHKLGRAIEVLIGEEGQTGSGFRTMACPEWVIECYESAQQPPGMARNASFKLWSFRAVQRECGSSCRQPYLNRRSDPSKAQIKLDSGENFSTFNSHRPPSRDIWSHIEFSHRRISDGFDQISFKNRPRKSRGPFIPVCRMQRVLIWLVCVS
jgi:hypothetical protein